MYSLRNAKNLPLFGHDQFQHPLRFKCGRERSGWTKFQLQKKRSVLQPFPDSDNDGDPVTPQFRYSELSRERVTIWWLQLRAISPRACTRSSEVRERSKKDQV